MDCQRYNWEAFLLGRRDQFWFSLITDGENIPKNPTSKWSSMQEEKVT